MTDYRDISLEYIAGIYDGEGFLNNHTRDALKKKYSEVVYHI